MFISPIMAFNYPKASNWIAVNIPLVVKKPRVYKAFAKYAEMSTYTAWIALSNATPPMITYEEMPGANGRFRGKSSPNTIFLAKAILERFENNQADQKDPRMHILLESTILHEMVHWGDWKDGHDHPLEEGKEFEKEAYGADVNRYW